MATTTEYNTSTITHIYIKPVVITSFTQDKHSGQIPVTVQFTNTSQNAVSESWAYRILGNNTYTSFSSIPSPSYTFTNHGNYTILLTATGGTGGYVASNTTTDYVLATTTEYNTSAVTHIYIFNPNFTATPLIGFNPLTVQFTDTTISNETISAWNWSFGDGITSILQNVSHTYTTDGVYNINFSVSTAHGTLWSNKTNLISVIGIAPPSISVQFIGAPTYAQAPANISFTDLSYSVSETISAWNWSFGDGEYSNIQNPVHNYLSSGTYSVSLNASSSTTYGTTTRTNYIVLALAPTPTPTPAPIVAQFIGAPTIAYASTNVSFTDLSYSVSETISAWNWSFGDGNYSTDQNPVYNYLTPGIYSVSLNASSSTTYGTTTRTNYVTISPKVYYIWKRIG